ncbi:UNVERIFIED_CONTAM: hypothetical protein GTU68_021729 [Idotea baltica]|nr:hypothetical protein [Idotea baltica]
MCAHAPMPHIPISRLARLCAARPETCSSAAMLKMRPIQRAPAPRQGPLRQ